MVFDDILNEVDEISSGLGAQRAELLLAWIRRIGQFS
jgi:hypothetical protein